VRLEVVVVDNASTDGAPEMAAAEFPHVRLIRNGCNAGYARACNQAARAARGRYLLFLNNDTIAPRGALRRLVRQARATPRLGALGPRLVDAAGREQRSVRGKPTVMALCHRLTLLRWTGLFRKAHDAFAGRQPLGSGPQPAEVLLGAALLMPRRVWRELGGWDERYRFGGEDIDLCLRAGRSHQVVHDPGAHIIHLGRVATRQRPGFVQGNTLVGLTRCLRAGGASEPAILLYKLLATLDLPVRLAELGLRWAWDRLRGRSGRRAALDLSGMTAFACRHLWAFWRA
jgi:GT2 family glycosyltransferase